MGRMGQGAEGGDAKARSESRKAAFHWERPLPNWTGRNHENSRRAPGSIPRVRASMTCGSFRSSPPPRSSRARRHARVEPAATLESSPPPRSNRGAARSVRVMSWQTSMDPLRRPGYRTRTRLRDECTQMARADLFDGSDPMSTLMRSIDWSGTPLGPVEGWPETLATALSICLASRFPIVIGWGPELLLLYNEAYRPILGARHPSCLGRPCYETYEEVVAYLKPMLDGVLATGVATLEHDFLFPLERNGYVEEAYFTLSHSALRDADPRHRRHLRDGERDDRASAFAAPSAGLEQARSPLGARPGPSTPVDWRPRSSRSFTRTSAGRRSISWRGTKRASSRAHASRPNRYRRVSISPVRRASPSPLARCGRSRRRSRRRSRPARAATGPPARRWSICRSSARGTSDLPRCSSRAETRIAPSTKRIEASSASSLARSGPPSATPSPTPKNANARRPSPTSLRRRRPSSATSATNFEPRSRSSSVHCKTCSRVPPTRCLREPARRSSSRIATPCASASS